MSAKGKKIKVVLVRGTAGKPRRHKLCVIGLGLRRVGQSVEVEDTPAIRGLIRKVRYMVAAEYPQQADIEDEHETE